MKRRNFLSALGGAAVAGPQAAKAAVSDMAAPVGQGASFYGPPTQVPATEKVNRARTALRELLSKTDDQRAAQRRRYHVERFTPNAYRLRSVNMQTKLELSRRELFERSERESEVSLRGIIAGWWDW